VAEIRAIMNQHLADHYAFYGEFTGVRTARKHIAWYTRGLKGANLFRHRMNTLESTDAQLAPSTHSSTNRRQSPTAWSMSTRMPRGRRRARQQQETGIACRMSRNAIDQCVRDSLDTYFRIWTAKSRPTSTTWCWRPSSGRCWKP
jgi:hypothetical protein